MGNEIVVLPLDCLALQNFEGDRTKLNIPHRDSRNCGRSGFGNNASISVEMARLANDEDSTDDDREPTGSEHPKPQHAMARTRFAPCGWTCGLMFPVRVEVFHFTA